MPLRSMTGFGQAEVSTPSGSYRVEIRSVNNRFFELQIRQPKFLFNLEQKIKQTISGVVSRGSVTVFISCSSSESDNRLSWDKEKVGSYIKIFREIQQAYGLPKDISLSDLIGFSDLITTESVAFDDDTLWSHLKPILEAAIKDLQKSRENEARILTDDLKKMIAVVLKAVGKIEKRAPLRLKTYRVELTKRIEQLIKNPPDPTRISAEVALMADRMDIREETTRLRAHFEKFEETFGTNEQVGKRMNFLLQEMNREANTIGSKANDLEISHLSVQLKEYIEKIREQIQNIE
jgi:uncharacterized protein (TIGR00255 family)